MRPCGIWLGIAATHRAILTHRAGGREGRWLTGGCGVADGLDVVAVGVADEGAVVVGVVLRPQPGLVQRLGAQRRGRGVERLTWSTDSAVKAMWTSRLGPMPSKRESQKSGDVVP